MVARIPISETEIQNLFNVRRAALLLRRELTRATQARTEAVHQPIWARQCRCASRTCTPLLRRERQVALRIAVISGALLRRRGLLLVVVMAIPTKFERRVNRGASQL